jgi:rare lipoprotein A
MEKSSLLLLLTSMLVVTLGAQAPEFGLASYYADQFQGKPTASGELYDTGKLTAAHKTYPFGSTIRVTRMDNRRSVEVRVNDRGPFISGRIVDLSRAAATQLAMLSEGSVSVMVELVGESESATQRQQAPRTTGQPPAAKPSPERSAAARTVASGKQSPDARPALDPVPVKQAAPVRKPITAAKPERKTSAPTSAEATPARSSAHASFDLFELTLKRPEKKGFGVQVSALRTQDALFRKVSELQDKWFTNILVSISPGKASGELQYKVILGSFPTEREAAAYKDNLQKNKKINGFVVNLSTL